MSLQLHKEILTRISDSKISWNSRYWDKLARQVQAHQRKQNPVFQQWLLQGEALPIIAFKEAKVCSFKPTQQTPYFESSGTTAETKSRHYFRNLDLYKTSVIQGWRMRFRIADGALRNGKRHTETEGFFAPLRMTTSGHPERSEGSLSKTSDSKKFRFIALMPSAKEAPLSSLSRMLQILMAELGDGEDFWAMQDEKWKWSELIKCLKNTVANVVDVGPRSATSATNFNRQLVLFGTAFAWVHFIDWCHERKLKFKLPSNTLVIETGGYKGRSRELSRDELHRLMGKLLGVRLDQIFCEYSMCEISSQAYSFRRKGKLLFQFPPWCRYRVVQPLIEDFNLRAQGRTRLPKVARGIATTEKGKPGVLEILDLANVDSCAFIRTEDMAIDHGGGFELLGRLPNTGLKGCSLSFE